MPRTEIEWFDARTRNRRDLDNDLNLDETVTYKICVRLVNEIHNTFCHETMSFAEKKVTNPYQCVSQPLFFSLVLCSHSLDRNLTGMAIADITLLSGFEVVTQNLDMVSGPLFIILSA